MSTTQMATPPLDSTSDNFTSEFDRHRQALVSREEDEEWESELRRYLRDVPADVTKDTDIVEWWSVSISHCLFDYVIDASSQ
jgi:hypothetical protein